MGDGHSVLGKSTGLVGANGGGGTEGFDSFEVLDQAVLFRHSLGGKSQADSDSSEETFWDIGDDDSDEEDDGFDDGVVEDHGEDEEGDAEEDGDGGDDVDESLDFLKTLSVGLFFVKLPGQWEYHQSRRWKQGQQFYP